MKWHRLTNGVYYLMLGLWFGALVMLAITAAATFSTVRASQTQMTPEAQNRLAGSIVGSAIDKLAVVEMISAAAIVCCVLLQCTVFKKQLGGCKANAVRIALLALVVAVLGGDRLIVAPTLHQHRSTMHAAVNETTRLQSKAIFDSMHQWSVRLASTSMLLLAAMTLISPFALTPKNTLDDKNI